MYAKQLPEMYTIHTIIRLSTMLQTHTYNTKAHKYFLSLFRCFFSPFFYFCLYYLIDVKLCGY